jgi:translation initiation factor 1
VDVKVSDDLWEVKGNNMNEKNSRLVFTTDEGRIKEISDKDTRTGDGIIKVRRETKGRKGKGVTTAKGFLECDDKVKVIAKKLKQRCSTGGTVKDGIIELQGEHRDAVRRELEDMGYVVKFSGG